MLYSCKRECGMSTVTLCSIRKSHSMRTGCVAVCTTWNTWEHVTSPICMGAVTESSMSSNCPVTDDANINDLLID